MRNEILENAREYHNRVGVLARFVGRRSLRKVSNVDCVVFRGISIGSDERGAAIQ